NNYNFDRANREINIETSQFGLLNKITYPTKGFTNLTYEPHSYWGEVTELPQLQMLNLTAVRGWGEPPVEDIEIINSFLDQNINIYGNAVHDIDNPECPEDTGHARGILSVTNLTQGGVQPY